MRLRNDLLALTLVSFAGIGTYLAFRTSDGREKVLTDPVYFSSLILQRGNVDGDSVKGELYIDRNENGRVDFGDWKIGHTLESPVVVKPGDYGVRSVWRSQGRLIEIVNSSGKVVAKIKGGNYSSQSKGDVLLGEYSSSPYFMEWSDLAIRKIYSETDLGPARLTVPSSN